MADQNSNEERKQSRERVRVLMGKHGKALVDPFAQRERFLAYLKKLYGYSNDKAVDEMERLLKQFRTMNRSLSFHRPRSIYKHTRVD